MAVTLAHVLKLEQRPLQAGIIKNLLRASPILEYIPFQDVNSLTSIAVRWTKLPSVAFRKINSGYTASEGDVDQIAESVYGFGGDIEIDRVYAKLGNMIQDPRALQIEMKSKAMALTFANYFVNGDHATDPDGFEGLKKRVANLPSRQTVNASGGTDILDPTASAANARKFIDKWEEASYKANQGDYQMILLNEQLLWGLGRVFRYLSVSGGPLLDITKDQFDREIMTYKGARMIDAGLLADQSTEVITLTEDPGDGGNDATSAYFVPLNMENGVHGIQLGPMEIYDPLDGGEKESKPTQLIRVEWWCGLSGWGSYGPTRLKNIETPASWT